MKKNKLVIIVVVLFFIVSVTLVLKRGLFNWQLPEDISNIPNNLPIVELNAEIYFLNEKIEYKSPLYLFNGRIYLPLDETINNVNGTIEVNDNIYIVNINSDIFNISRNDENLYPFIIEIESKEYISIFNLLANSKYVPVFDSILNRIDIFYKENKIVNKSENKKEVNSAYLRLEDIMADGVDSEGYYNDVGLENLRAIADFLYDNNQKFYIAWIPLYKNPKNNIENDLTKDFNLYNASFLYTLDYLVYKGGKIGIHGYTHQYNDEKSADGYEFDKKTPYSQKECANRMLLAKEVARDLRFEVNFFEFPHYGATKNTLRYAENYYDVIYQRNTKFEDGEGNIVEVLKKDGSVVKYVPTPADYIISRYDIDGINSRIDNSIKNNWIVSLFYHPKIDFEVMYRKTENNVRICNVNEYCAIYKLIEKINKENFSFAYF